MNYKKEEFRILLASKPVEEWKKCQLVFLSGGDGYSNRKTTDYILCARMESGEEIVITSGRTSKEIQEFKSKLIKKYGLWSTQYFKATLTK